MIDAYELVYSYAICIDCALHLVKWQLKWCIFILYKVTCRLCEVPMIYELKASLYVYECMFPCWRNEKERFEIVDGSIAHALLIDYVVLVMECTNCMIPCFVKSSSDYNDSLVEWYTYSVWCFACGFYQSPKRSTHVLLGMVMIALNA